LKVLPQTAVTFSDGTQSMKGGFVIMREGDFAKPVCFEIFGAEKLAVLEGLQTGMLLQVHFYAESRESKQTPGRYFTSLRCTNVVNLAVQPTAAAPAVEQQQVAPQLPITPQPSWPPVASTPTAEPGALPPDNDLPF